MKGRKGFTLIELLVVIAIIAVLAAILFPVLARARKAAQTADCQSNMSQIGRAVKMYLSEWHDMYPAQRDLAGNPQKSIILTPVTVPPDPDGKPHRFSNGVNWVEALYPYVEAISQGNAGAWKCGAASNKTEPYAGTGTPSAGSLSANVTYSFNYNLIEQPEGVIRTASNLMMCRELDRRMNSVLKPSVVCTTSAIQPQNTFLTAKDSDLNPLVGAPQPLQHNMGSNVLFADSHVKNFSLQYYPQGDGTGKLPVASSWDVNEAQWFNFNDAAAVSTAIRKSIAISP